MALADLLGLGGQTEFLTDWDSARDFVIFDVIVNNPRITEQEKVDLQKIEQDAFIEHSGKLLESERTEIAQYFNYINNQARTATSDAKLLNVFAELAGASKDAADPDAAAGIDVAGTAAKAGNTVATVLILAGVFYVFSKK